MIFDDLGVIPFTPKKIARFGYDIDTKINDFILFLDGFFFPPRAAHTQCTESACARGCARVCTIAPYWTRPLTKNNTPPWR